MTAGHAAMADPSCLPTVRSIQTFWATPQYMLMSDAGQPIRE